MPKTSQRTQQQIEKDYIKIKKTAESVKSFKQLEAATGLSYCEIITSLRKHPRILEKIKKHFEDAKKSGEKRKITKKTAETLCKKVVIDTSLTGVPEIESVLKEESAKIVLTQVVIKELSRMQHFEDSDAMRARHILAMPAENEEKFIHELISEEYETADRCILEYCLQNKDNVVLYTADKEMFNFAKVYKVPVKLFRSVSTRESISKRSITFGGAEKIGKDLIVDLDKINTSFRRVIVISEGREYSEGIVKFKVGDEIFLASNKREGYVAFAHYKIISLWKENHCDLIFSKRLYDLGKLDFNYKYKCFLREFKRTIS